VALAIDVKDRTDSGLWVGGLLVADFLPTILVGLTLGPLLDRLPRRSLMVGADLVRAAVFCALPFAPGAGTIVVLAAVAGLATGFVRPAVLAGVPNLVDDEQLPAANALLQATENASWAVGPVLGGLLTAAAGPDAAYWINAVSFLLSALLIARVPQRLLQSAEALTRGHWRDLADGFVAVRRSRPLLTVLVVWSVASIGSGIANVVEIFLAKDTLSAGDFGYGLLFGATGFGLVVGNVVAAPLDERLGLARAYPLAIVVMGAGYGVTALSPNVWAAAVFLCIVGIGNGIAGVCNPLLVQRGASDAMRGRALTLVMSVNFLAVAVGFAIAGPLLDTLGVRGAIGLAAGIFVVAMTLAAFLVAGIRAPARAAEAGAPL